MRMPKGTAIMNVIYPSLPTSRRPWRIFLPALLVLPMLPALATAEPVRFEFNPPTPLTFRETVVTTRSDSAGFGRQEKITIGTTNEIHLVGTDDGYTMTIRPEAPVEIRGGQEAPIQSNPLTAAVENAVLTYTLDADGRLLTVTGYEEVLARVGEITDAMEEQLSDRQRRRFAETASAVRNMLTPEVLLNRMRVEWSGRIADFAGAELEVGETITSESDFPLPYGGTIRYFNAVRLEELVPCGEKQCAKIVYSYDTDADALSDFVGRTLEGTGGPAPSDARVSGGGSRVIDPDTLLIHSETQRRTIVMQVTSRQRDRTFTIRREETREYTYDYGPAAASAAPGD